MQPEKKSWRGGFLELNRDQIKITRAVGEKVRSQMLEQKEPLYRELLQELGSANSQHVMASAMYESRV